MIQDNLKTTTIGMKDYLGFLGEWNKTWHAITADLADYSKRSAEDGTAAFEKLISADSMAQALEIQFIYTRRAQDDYLRQISKICAMYRSFARDLFNPMESAFQKFDNVAAQA
jgi:hypothetical protein